MPAWYQHLPLWALDFLSNRPQIDNLLSSTITLTTDMLQGYVLSPLMYTVHFSSVYMHLICLHNYIVFVYNVIM